MSAAALVPAVLVAGAALGDTGSAYRATASSVSSAAAGEANAAAPLASLSGKKIFLDPGHNGANDASINKQVPTGRGGTKDCQTTGTSGDDGFAEHTFNWDVAYRLYEILEAQGAQVIFSRGDDTSVGPCVDARAAAANKWPADAVVSIHADGAPAADHGFHVNLSSPPLNTAQQTSQRYATAMRDAMVSAGFAPADYIGSGGIYPRSDLAGLNLSTVPAVLVEAGNMKNADDEKVMNSADGQQRIAQALADGVAAFLGGATK